MVWFRDTTNKKCWGSAGIAATLKRDSLRFRQASPFFSTAAVLCTCFTTSKKLVPGWMDIAGSHSLANQALHRLENKVLSTFLWVNKLTKKNNLESSIHKVIFCQCFRNCQEGTSSHAQLSGCCVFANRWLHENTCNSILWFQDVSARHSEHKTDLRYLESWWELMTLHNFTIFYKFD